MSNRWGAPVAAVGLVALVWGAAAGGAYFGVTNYSGDAPPASCAQTHFVTACETPGLEPAVFSAETAPPAPTVDDPIGGRTAVSPVEYETVPQTVTETVYRPVTETVMKECRRIVYETVCETHYKEYTVTRRKKVREEELTAECFQVCKTVTDTVFKDQTRTVCKPVAETHYRECVQKGWEKVAEPAVRETARVVYREVTETVYQPVCRRVKETVVGTKKVCRKVPEMVCETVCVPSRLTWQEVPRYECCFDPCTCSTTTKQVGTRRKLVREPAHQVTRQVARCKIVVEEVPDTTVVCRLVTEKVPVTVVKRVPEVVHDRVAVTVIRTVPITRTVQVPYTVTKRVPTVETTHVAVSVQRTLRGAYVDVSALTPEASAKLGPGRDYVTGGPASVGAAGAPTYDAAAPGRVFVEGLQGTRIVTRSACKMVPVTEVQRIPYQVARVVPREVVCTAPTTVTRLVPTTVTRVVPVRTCRPATSCPCKETGIACSPPCGPVCASTGWLRSLFNRPCRPHPIRDFFHRLVSARVTCTACKPGPCGACVVPCPPSGPAAKPVPVVTVPPEKAPAAGTPQTLPPIPPSTLPPAAQDY